GHAAEQFTRIALANPRMHLVLKHNGRIVHELPATAELADRLQRFHGRELVERLIPVDSESDGVRLWGYVAHPSQSKSTRKGQYLFLNGRFIQDRSLQHALGEAYRGLLMTGRYPIAFLFLEMAPELADVNVHPTKSEVRFRDGRRLYRQLLACLRNRFLGMELDGAARPGADAVPKPPVDPRRQGELELDFVKWAKEELAAAVVTPIEDRPRVHDLDDDELRNADSGLRDSSVEPVEPNADHPQSVIPNPHSPLPRVMQVHDCYLVLESDEGLTVVDQHALHERILYEQLRERVLNGNLESQRMLVPEPVELADDETAALREHADLLGELGFAVEEFGGNTLLLSAYPAMLDKADHAQLLRDLAERILSADPDPDRRDLLDHLLHTMACRAAIKAGQRLSTDEMQSLLAQRRHVENSHHCPHGRPTALVLSRHELDRQFGRLG
ncbi:MAG: DNA mismatch repair endonuclease MutL, partial [Planctomycetaceae bacterium]